MEGQIIQWPQGQQRSTKHYTENKKSNKTNHTKIRG